MSAYSISMIRLALLAGGVFVLSASHAGHALADGYGHRDRGYDYDDVATDIARRHHEAKRRHYDRVRRFEESHDGYGRDDDRRRYDGDDYRGYDDDYVCDPDGDRCYRSDSPYWDYREYYRRHGYRWLD